MSDLLDFINSQNHSDDQLDQVLQTYQTYTESQSPTRQVNAHITYHVAQANPAMHQSFVDGPDVTAEIRQVSWIQSSIVKSALSMDSFLGDNIS